LVFLETALPSGMPNTPCSCRADHRSSDGIASMALVT
jgi:hypothetical protein